VGSNIATNWQIRQNDKVPGDLTITPSTAAGGTTFTTPAMTLDSSGNMALGRNLYQAQNYVIYPGSTYGLPNNQANYYISSRADWGIYTNTSFIAAGGLYSRGYAVLTGVNTLDCVNVSVVNANETVSCSAGYVMTGFKHIGAFGDDGPGNEWIICCPLRY